MVYLGFSWNFRRLHLFQYRADFFTGILSVVIKKKDKQCTSLLIFSVVRERLSTKAAIVHITEVKGLF
jgi:hypothetical protein